MTINPNQIGALIVAVVLGNALLLQLWGGRPSGEVSSRRRWIALALLAAFPIALCFAGWEMYWNRSEDVMLGVMLYLPMQAVFTAVMFFRYHRRGGSPSSWGRLLIGNGLVLLVLLTLTLAVGEIYFRFVYDTTDSIAYTKVAQRWIQRHYQFNHAGFRDNLEYVNQIAPAKRRVSFVGDSFTAGHGIKEAEDRFANRLRQRHPDWEVHVLAVNALDTGGEVSLLEDRAARGYEFDFVVLVYCLNDIGDLVSEWAQAQASLTNRVAGRLPVYDDSFLLDIAYHRLTIAQIPAVKNYFAYVRDGYRGEKWEEQQQRLRELRAVVSRSGGKLAVVTFPFLHALGPEYEYQFVHEQLDQFWRAENVPHLDLLTVFKDYPPTKLTVNSFDAHPNEFANALAATAIDEFLLREMKTNPRSAAETDQSGLSPQSR